MIVRIQLGTGRRVNRKAGKNRHLAFACEALLLPAAFMAYVFGLWRLASDMGLVVGSGVTGLLAHWQVPMAAAVFLHLAATVLNRYGRQGEFQIPQVLKLRMLPLRPAEPEPKAHSEESFASTAKGS